ncbi:hypothetical protein [Microbacterium sp. T32]|uniref:hypothetical protein n=1 Tax=Microbacterium sp. T32 TaxID=1776083 RepID=UPI0012E96976|nr:hypothetical protein [Microbacterium sp. T32]
MNVTAPSSVLLLQVESPGDAVALLREHLAEKYPELGIRQVRVEMDNSRSETIVRHFCLFSSSRVSRLDEYASIDSFRWGSVIEPQRGTMQA